MEAWIGGGKFGVLIAADLESVSRMGHFAAFPSDEQTVLVQSPFEGDVIPGHTVLYEGQCRMEELVGYE